MEGEPLTKKADVLSLSLRARLSGREEDKRKIETEMRGLCDERFGRSGRARDGGVVDGDGWRRWQSQRNGISDEEWEKNRRPVSVPASPRTKSKTKF